MKENFSIKKFILFALAGSTSAASNFIIYFVLLNWVHFWYLWASIIAFILSIFIGFYMQKFIAFKDKSSTSFERQIIMFFMISFGNLFINVVLMLFFVETLHINKLVAKVMSIGILACWNFFVYQKFVFNNKRSPL